MRIATRLATATGAVALLLAGCGGQPSVRAGSEATLTVHSSLERGPNGAEFIEGALVEVTLRGPDGAEIGTRRADPGTPVVFTGLDPGEYTLEPALRPCDGNCGTLDARTGGCRDRVRLPDRQVVRVRFVVGSDCRILAATGD